MMINISTYNNKDFYIKIMEADTFRLKTSQNSEVSIENLEEPPEKICRICFESEIPDNLLISPCRCKGSMKYVHQECLKVWLLSQFIDLNESTCDICKNKLYMNIKLQTIISCENLRNECSKLAFIPIVIGIFFTILVVVLIYLVNAEKKNNI